MSTPLESFDALSQLTATLDDFYARFKSGSLRPSTANAVIKQLARILVPLDHPTLPRFLHDPALPRPPIPAFSLANSLASLPGEQIKFARVELVPRKKQVVQALHDAAKLVRAAIGQ